MKPFLDDQTKALFRIGFVKVIDGMLFVSLLINVAISVYDALSGKLTAPSLVQFICLQVTFSSTWLIILCYRILYQILMARADINTMPESAAKAVLSFKLKQ
jgi:hypothetical protein